jgi:hypothetical protein
MASPSIDVAIADAVVARLTAAASELPEGSVIERRLLPAYKTSQLRLPRICVAPRLQSRDNASRKHSRREHVVQIAPHLMAEHDDGQVSEAQLATFVGIMETVADIIERAALANHLFAGATFVRMATEPLYDIQTTQTPGYIRGVLTCTFVRLASPPPLNA